MTPGVKCSSSLSIATAMPTRKPSYKDRARILNSSICIRSRRDACVASLTFSPSLTHSV